MTYIEGLMSTGETVQRVSRQHWISLAGSILRNGLAMVVLIALAIWSGGQTQGGASATLLSRVALLLALVPLGLALKDTAFWYVKRYVVTTRRVIEIEGLISRTVRDSNLDKVNDLVLRQSLGGRMLDYGDIEILTGSDAGVNKLERLASPVVFKRAILDNKEDFDTLARQRVEAAARAATLAVESAAAGAKGSASES
jgi:uncharacterized membrane protein YdbT with pleckstrin-like domain